VLTIGGVVLASASGQQDQNARESSPPQPGRRRSGVPYALAAMLAWGVATYVLARSAKHLGWFVPVAVSRVVTLAVLVVAAAAAALGRRARQGRPAPAAVPPAALALPAVAGLLDVLAFLAFARAGQVGSVAVAAAASACFPLIVIAGGVLVFKERPRTVQFVGAGLTIAGLLVLGLRR
jgi:drug/metabolite transporter (DMT)-like permease